jgi:hypothetical protein
VLLVASLAAAAIVPGARSAPGQTESGADLSIAEAVVCASINGFAKYEVLPDAALTSEEKLLLYYRPLNFQVKREGPKDHIHLVQDGQIRRRGEKLVLVSKTKMIDFDWKAAHPIGQIYMKSAAGLKNLQPGEYEFDIILHDALAPGAPVARQSVPFRIVPPGPRSGGGEAKSSGGRESR